MMKKNKDKKEDKNQKSGYHSDKEKGHMHGQQSPEAEPKHDPPKRRKKDDSTEEDKQQTGK